MVRSLLGYSVVAVVAYFAFQLLLGLFGIALAIMFKLLIFAAIGFGVYLLLKVISPGTARRVREKINGEPLSQD